MEELAALKTRMQRQGLDVALNHLSQAEAAFGRREWEAANAQVRTCLEAVFDRVAAIRLGSTKTGGTARKQLQSEGILREAEANLIRGFFNVAGAAGSHPGRSDEDEAQGRLLIGLGICYMASGLIPELVRVEEVLSSAGTPSGARLTTDAEVTTSCPTCGEEQVLANCALRRDGLDTVYKCRNGCQVVVVVSESGDSPWPGRGYRLRDYTIRNAKDLRLPVIDKHTGHTTGVVLIPSSSAALMKRRPTEPS